jgi:hypothetical protein
MGFVKDRWIESMEPKEERPMGRMQRNKGKRGERELSMIKARLWFCFFGTQLIEAEPVRSALYATKIVSMPCLPPVGTRLGLIESAAVSEIAGWCNGPIASVRWEEHEPHLFQIHFAVESAEPKEPPMDYLETQWLINELREVGWSCDQEGD